MVSEIAIISSELGLRVWFYCLLPNKRDARPVFHPNTVEGPSFLLDIREGSPALKLGTSDVSCLTLVSADDTTRGSGPSYANVDMPWRCLCLGFAVHNTYTRPRRLTVLQNSHIFLTDDLTFMVTDCCCWRLYVDSIQFAKREEVTKEMERKDTNTIWAWA